ncbi:MAG: ATP-binding protein [Terracidiphilus sp.]
MPSIRVHEKALAHLSRGLYRSPASALRELVSNSWDANATAVRLSTNYPNFYQLAVEDNGDGFSAEEFARLMGGGIGNSEKRPMAKVMKYGRPIIGRLGIGMLGIAQICGSFTVTSKMKDGAGFRARVNLYDLLKEKLDSDDSSVVPPSSERGFSEVDVGTYDFEDQYDLSKAKFGTTIATDDVHPTFVRAFQQSLKFEKFQKPPSRWQKAIDIVSSVRSIQELGDYWRLLWELAASCPVPYVSANCLPQKLVSAEQKLLESYNFKVIVDSLELKKPIHLKGNPAGYTIRRIQPQHLTPYGKNLRFHGYIIVQEGAQLKPDELRGLLIRIKNVAIGYYDPGMLDYRYNEGPRSRWLTGEIYATEGLEDALNIDRDSFNRFHPQFRAMQEYVHTILHESVFPEVYKQIEVRSSDRAQTKRTARTSHLTQVLSDAVTTPVSVRSTAKSSDQAPARVSLKREPKRLKVVIPDEANIQTKRSNRQLASSILALFEVAMNEPDDTRRREVFRRSLLSLLSKW